MRVTRSGVMFQVKLMNRCIVGILLGLCVWETTASPADDVVEAYLRASRMDTLLEVQLESRLDDADSDEERALLAEELASLYLGLLRELDQQDPYFELIHARAKLLLNRVAVAPMSDLRLELLIGTFSSNENAIQMHRLELLKQNQRESALAAFRETQRGLHAMMGTIEPELNRAQRRGRQSLSMEESREVSENLSALQRQHSLGQYYLGWSGYGIAVLEDRHVSDETMMSFGWLLGGDGGLPQSSELRGAALEYEHVARAAIGVAMCYAQSEGYAVSRSWLQGVIETETVKPEIRGAARHRLLQVYAMERNWYEARLLAIDLAKEGEGGLLTLGDARFIAMQALQSRVSGPPGRGGRDEADAVARFGIEQLVELGEIGHVVDLYRRYDQLPIMAAGFVPTYARALSELEDIENDQSSTGYLSVAERFSQALGAADAGEYIKHREDCELKLAYVLIVADRPQDALSHCKHIIESSLSDVSIEEARWLQIAAFDQINALEQRSTSSELDAAVRAYVQAYPNSERTTKLVLRHAMRGTVDQQLAIDTLSSISENDPIVLPARRTLVQLQYQIIRDAQDDTGELLDSTLDLARWLIDRPDAKETPQATLAVARIALELSIERDPPDIEFAKELVALSMELIDMNSNLRAHESEVMSRSLQVFLLEGQIGRAQTQIDRIRSIDERRAENAEVLVLNYLIDQWEQEKSSEVAGHLLDLGPVVLARLLPKAPARISVRTSSLAEVIMDAGMHFSEDPDSDAHQLSLQLARQLIERGSPSEPGLRLTTRLADNGGDDITALEAWLRLLAAYPAGEDRWFEARYESLVILSRVDVVRAKATLDQFRILNPQLGGDEWREKFEQLIQHLGFNPDPVEPLEAP